MKYTAIATDYDGTIANQGKMSELVVDSFQRLRESHLKIILVTGRILEDLRTVCRDLHLFHCIVAENGGLLYFPKTDQVKLLTHRPPENLIQALKQAKLPSLSFGQVISATVVPYDAEVLKIIQELQLDYQLSYNREAVMILPTGIDKGTGLLHALEEFHLSPEGVVGFGDAENDLPFLQSCGLSVAVANALPLVQSKTDRTSRYEAGQGVAEWAEKIMHSNII